MKILDVKNLSKVYGKGDTMVKAFVISNSCGSALWMPVRTAPYSTGSTIKKLMSTESDAPRTHTSARMIKLATGVALTSCSTGASSTSAVCGCGGNPQVLRKEILSSALQISDPH